MKLLASKLSACINYKLRKSSKANAKKSKAASPQLAPDSSSSPPTKKRQRKAKSPVLPTEISFTPHTVPDLTTPAPLTTTQEETLHDTKYGSLLSIRSLVKKSSYVYSKDLKVFTHTAPTPLDHLDQLKAICKDSSIPETLMDLLDPIVVKYIMSNALQATSDSSYSCSICNETNLPSSGSGYYCSCPSSRSRISKSTITQYAAYPTTTGSTLSIVAALDALSEYISIVESPF
jgi:hypothetical protein